MWRARSRSRSCVLVHVHIESVNAASNRRRSCRHRRGTGRQAAAAAAASVNTVPQTGNSLVRVRFLAHILDGARPSVYYITARHKRSVSRRQRRRRWYGLKVCLCMRAILCENTIWLGIMLYRPNNCDICTVFMRNKCSIVESI